MVSRLIEKELIDKEGGQLNYFSCVKALSASSDENMKRMLAEKLALSFSSLTKR